MHKLSRRSFGTLAAGGLIASALPAVAGADKTPAPLIIDGLGGFGDPNRYKEGDPFASRKLVLSDRGIRDALASGLTAMNLTLGYVAGKDDPFEQSVREIGKWNAAIRAASDRLLKVYDISDIARARQTGRLGVIFGFQNAVQIGEDPERVDIFANLGMRIIQLTYNDRNQIGCGSVVTEDTGLTDLGRQIVERLNQCRVLVDASHGGPQTILDAIDQSSAPMAITHTGCRALADLPRNVSDETLKKLADRGGVAGIYFMPFLNKGPQPYAEAVVRHIEHAVNVAGEDHVGIGTDNPVTAIDDMPAYRAFIRKEVAQRAKAGVSAPGEQGDIVPMIPDLQGIDKYRKLMRLLDQRGFSSGQIEKIMGLNFHRLMKEVWA
ncbi:dipeptidase [Emcibacter nanhaiensis]|uniref:Peptidase M19 n=1 Tax=Emcibacter nanhaiensis TaxID=1505037 RepID=A0A501PB81_9PROT|nr:membrane dipeptidase [Emcibacter nanhaiensis]TPD57448.1 peptidase M19 [Emcibacter nanhaiensis]